MNQIFLIDYQGPDKWLEADLLRALNAPVQEAFKFIEFHNCFDFIVQLIRGLVHHQELTLIHQNHPEDKLRQKYIVNPDISFNSGTEMVQALLQSKGSIRLASSGTTGPPQWSTHAFPQFLKQLRIGKTHQQDRWLWAYHPAHLGGLQVFFQALLNRNSIVYVFGAPRATVLNAIQEYQISHLSATPTFYRLLSPFTSVFPKVKRLTMGGERYDESLMVNLREMFPNANFNNIYASTETGTLLVSKNQFFRIPQALQPYIQIRANALWVHHTLLAQPTSSEEWHPTGDYVEWVDEEHFKITSRASDWVNVAGNRVHLSGVEQHICQLDGIEDCQVFARKNMLTGHLLTCKVIRQDSPITASLIKQQLSKNLLPHQIPRIIQFVDQLTYGPTGKTQRS